MHVLRSASSIGEVVFEGLEPLGDLCARRCTILPPRSEKRKASRANDHGVKATLASKPRRSRYGHETACPGKEAG